MNDTETKKVLALLRAAYPAFYSKMGKSELYGVVALWQEEFAEEPYEIVAVAVKSLIKTHSGYPPDIAAVYGELKNVVAAATGEPTDTELWNVYKEAVQDSGYQEEKVFNALPPILQLFAGSPNTLHEHAQTKLETFNTVLYSNFLKQIPNLRKRQEYKKNMPEDVRKAICGLAEKKKLSEPQKHTPQQLNDKRNAIAAELAALPPPNPEYVPISAEEREKRRQKIIADMG